MSQEIKIIAHQSLFDLAVQSCGKIDHLVEIAALNNLSSTANLTNINTIKTPTINNEIQNYFKNNAILVATDVEDKNKKTIDYRLPYSL